MKKVEALSWIDIIKAELNRQGELYYYDEAMECIAEYVAAAPERGSWRAVMNHSKFPRPELTVKCQFCGFQYDLDKKTIEEYANGKVKLKLYNFCPECGADMRKKG